MNIILFISDTFRKDHLPCYGNNKIITPNFTKFANESIIFDDMRPSSFPTVPARADVFTGRYTFLYQDWGPLNDKEVTLSECLSKAGYLTMGIVDTPFLVRNGYGYDRGFHDFIYVRGQRSGAELNDVISVRKCEEQYFAPRTLKTASDWLERHYQQKFFLYIDTWDPHEPWDPPEYYTRKYYPNYNGENIMPNYWEYEQDGFTKQDLEIAHACYCGEISMIDRWFGFLLERLRTLNILENTMIIFTSDHGFYFGEHNLFGKRRFRWHDQMQFDEGYAIGRTDADGFTFRSPLHNEITQIPLIMHLPGISPCRVEGLATLADLMPTILDVIEEEVPERVQGKTLLPLIAGESKSIHDIVVTAAPFEDLGKITKTVDDNSRITKEISPSTITDGKWDLLYGTYEAGQYELYRTKEDVGHQNNLIERYPEVAKELHGKFLNWLRENQAPEEIIEPRSKF